MRRAAVLCLALACSSHRGGARPSQGSAAVAVLPDVPFEDLDHDQRRQFMREVVVPAMKPLFQQHDAEEFAGFGCETCHGKAGVASGTYAQPNGKLPALDLTDLKSWKARDVEFMERVVAPTMTKLLRAREQIRCLACHTAR
jgi:hypothetical protein